MSNTKKTKEKNKQKGIEKLKDEYFKNVDERFRNEELLKNEVINAQPPIHYPIRKRQIELEIGEVEVKLKQGHVGFRQTTPKFDFEKTIEYEKQLEKMTKFLLDIKKKDLEDLEYMWTKFSDNAREQLKIIDKRQPLIMQELEELGFNTKELKTNKPDYIG